MQRRRRHPKPGKVACLLRSGSGFGCSSFGSRAAARSNSRPSPAHGWTCGGRQPTGYRLQTRALRRGESSRPRRQAPAAGAQLRRAVCVRGFARWPKTAPSRMGWLAGWGQSRAAAYGGHASRLMGVLTGRRLMDRDALEHRRLVRAADLGREMRQRRDETRRVPLPNYIRSPLSRLLLAASAFSRKTKALPAHAQVRAGRDRLLLLVSR